MHPSMWDTVSKLVLLLQLIKTRGEVGEHTVSIFVVCEGPMGQAGVTNVPVLGAVLLMVTAFVFV